MNARECIMGRRSIRSYTDQPIPHELIDEVVEAASYAPSWKHTQIVRYIAVEGSLKAEVAKCTSGYAGNGVIIDQAPMAVVVTIIKNRSGFERDGSILPTGATAGRCMMPVLPAKRSAWPPMTRVSAPLSWVLLTMIK